MGGGWHNNGQTEPEAGATGLCTVRLRCPSGHPRTNGSTRPVPLPPGQSQAVTVQLEPWASSTPLLLAVTHLGVPSVIKSCDSIRKTKIFPSLLHSTGSDPTISRWAWGWPPPYLHLPLRFTCFTSHQVIPLLRTLWFIQEDCALHDRTEQGPQHFLPWPPTSPPPPLLPAFRAQ